MRPLRRRTSRSFGLLQDSRLWIVAALALGTVTAATMVSTIHDTSRQRAVIRAVALATGERIATAAAARVEALALATFTGAETVGELAARQRQAERCRCPPALPVLAFAEWHPRTGRVDTLGVAAGASGPPVAVIASIAASLTARPRIADRPSVQLIARPELGAGVALAMVRFDSAGPAAVDLAVARTPETIARVFGPEARRITAMDAKDNPIALLDSSSVAVADSAGHRLFGAVDSTRPYRATIHLKGPLDGLVLSLALDHAQVAGRIGALVPGRELWHLGLLLLGTVLVVVLAVRSSRREAVVARARTDFVAGVSHDLRMPLAQVLLAAETLALGRDRGDAERRTLLTSIVRETKRLIGLVENVLLFSRAGAIGLRPNVGRVDVAGLFTDVVEATRLSVDDAGQSLEVVGSSDAAVDADRGLVRQALVNLIDNAVKYGRPGGRIRLGAEATAGAVRLYVEDDGPGVPAAERARVFEPYERLGRDQDSERTGSGLGLAVVRSIAEACRGRALIETAPTGGARAILELPAAA
jgi:signal transduction histidine kinase